MPVLNLDALTLQTLDVVTTVDGVERMWKLRMDVPSSKLIPCFALLELERERPQIDFAVEIEGEIDFAAARALGQRMAAHEKQIEEETLSICLDIFQWSDSRVTAEDLRASMPHHARRQVVAHFFLILLARSGKLPSASMRDSSSTDSPNASPTEAKQAKRTKRTRKTAPSPTSRERDSIPSAMRSSADSPRPLPAYLDPRGQERMEPTKATTIPSVTLNGTRGWIS